VADGLADLDKLKKEVGEKYQAVAAQPTARYDFSGIVKRP